MGNEPSKTAGSSYQPGDRRTKSRSWGAQVPEEGGEALQSWSLGLGTKGPLLGAWSQEQEAKGGLSPFSLLLGSPFKGACLGKAAMTFAESRHPESGSSAVGSLHPSLSFSFFSIKLEMIGVLNSKACYVD